MPLLRPPGPPPWSLPSGGRAWPGQDPAVVLVHGTARSSRTLVPLGRRLAALGHAVLAPDLPRGDVARQAAALRAALPDGAAVLVGLSGGCRVAVEVARERDALVLVGPPEPEPAARHARRLAVGSLLEVPTLKPALLREKLLGVRPDRSVARAEWDRDLPDVPALVLRGEHDTVTSSDWAAHVVGRLPQGRLLVVDEAAHDLHWSAPHVVARAVAQLAAGASPEVSRRDTTDPLAPPHVVPTAVHTALELAAAALALTVPRRAGWGPRPRAVLAAAGLAATANALSSRRVPRPLHLNLDSGGGLLLLLAAATVLRGEPRPARLATAALGLGAVAVADATSRPVGPARLTQPPRTTRPRSTTAEGAFTTSSDTRGSAS